MNEPEADVYRRARGEPTPTRFHEYPGVGVADARKKCPRYAKQEVCHHNHTRRCQCEGCAGDGCFGAAAHPKPPPGWSVADRTTKGREASEEAAQGPPRPEPMRRPADTGGSVMEPEKTGKTPRRKVLAGAAGGGIGGQLAVILAHHLPEVPPTVIAAYSSLVVTALALAAAYLSSSES